MSTPETEKLAAAAPAPRGRSRRRFLTGVATGGLLGSLLAGGLSVYAHSHRGPGWWSRAGHSHHWGQHRHGVGDPEAAGERAEFVTDWVLSRIDASAEQRQQVQAMVQNAVKELLQVREQHQTNRQALLEALGRSTINRDALAEIRRAELELVDAASDRIVATLADVAEVLTPEQRSRLLEFATRWHR